MAAYSRSSKKQDQRAPHYCYAENCGREVVDGLFMCGNHWALLPGDLKMALADAYVQGQDDDENLVTMIWLDAAMRCITYVAARERRQGK
jgi:hypothetical protein